MRVEFQNSSYITDDTNALDSNTIFLKTAQNSKYYDKLDNKPKFITPKELIKEWGLNTLKIVGITGTNGKTTVSAGIYSILIDLGERVALQGTRGFFINDKRVDERSMTTPSILETLHNMKQAKDRDASYFIMEVSSHAIAQNRIEDIKFALKVHTNVTQDHLDYHKTIEEYRAVKSSFFADDTPKLLNKDEIKNITYNPKNAQSYGVDEPATFKVQAFSLLNGITAGIKHLSKEATIYSPMVGLFNLFNIMASIGASVMLTGKDIEEVASQVSNFAGVAGRMEVINYNPMIIVDFAHTPDGMLKALDSMKDKDISVVFGAGGNRDRDKRAKMGRVASKFAKKVYITNDNPRDEKPEDIIQDILNGIKDQSNVRAMVDRAFAISEAINELKEDEVLMILGKGDEPYQEINGMKYPYNDKNIVAEIIKNRKS
ncbi:UDP-N-acetylmuramoylalanyl-D-glutamate--2,6-diaminopimelate ligase [hydrothermal vent metagenome]|uniref:UDP-N-acetylmuramoylalanyl-D-glutamate--2,6-diaminopimelate ligase n=1 Tax=hydrothermal vent metagenome TaxID=652676 RepID=A0A1W1EIE3_9ZZZZ